jgi:hypothetical protein
LAEQLLAYLHVICLSALNFSHVAICQAASNHFVLEEKVFLASEGAEKNLNAHRYESAKKKHTKSTGFRFSFPIGLFCLSGMSKAQKAHMP